MQAIGPQPQRASDGAPVHYERHRPEQTTLYRLVQQHAATFFEQAEAEDSVGLPQYVKDEFDAFLECAKLRWRCSTATNSRTWRPARSCPAWPIRAASWPADRRCIDSCALPVNSRNRTAYSGQPTSSLIFNPRDNCVDNGRHRPVRPSWAKLLKRVLATT